MKQRRFVSILALLLTLCLLLGACGEPPVEPGNTTEGTQSQETTGTETPDALAPNVEANTEISGTVMREMGPRPGTHRSPPAGGRSFYGAKVGCYHDCGRPSYLFGHAVW